MTTDEHNDGALDEQSPIEHCSPLADQEWELAFMQQLHAPDFTERMERYARSRGWRLALADAILDDNFAADLVQQVLFDTLDGRLTWHPARVDLVKHVMDAIKARTSHARKRCERFHHYSLERSDAGAEPAMAAHEEGVARHEIARRARRVLDGLRALAVRDADVLLLLDAYDNGVTKRKAVMRFTALSAKRYDAACARMRRMRDDLPADLLPDGRYS